MAGTLAQRIRKARHAKGLTQVEVARRLATTQPTICRWENGTTAPPRPVLLRLADLLDVPELAK